MTDCKNPFDRAPETSIAHRCLLAIPGVLPHNSNEPFIGKAWPKKSKNGRLYHKFKFDCFITRAGKTFYSRGWERKSQPGFFDIHAEELPFAARQLLFLNKDREMSFRGIPCDDGSMLLMADYDFVTD
jgi:hypothetical protein